MAMRVPELTVLITTYRSGPHLEAALASIATQTHRDFELLAVDDASGDGTVGRLQAFGDPRLRLIVQPDNRGVAAARNRGLAEAQGRYLAVLDHDDLWAPDKLARQLATMRARPELLMLATEVTHLTGRRERLPEAVPTDPVGLHWALMTGCAIAQSSVMIDRLAVRQRGLVYDETLRCGEDLAFFHRVAEAGPIACLSQRLTRYRVHEQGLSGAAPDKTAAAGAQVMAQVMARWLDRPVAPLVARAYWDGFVNGRTLDLELCAQAGRLYGALLTAFCARLTPADRAGVARLAAQRWWRLAALSALTHGGSALALYRSVPALATVGPTALARAKHGLKRLTRRSPARPV